MGGTRRRGLRPDPMTGWPLDEVLVGVATLRTMRELIRQSDRAPLEGPRAWDLALQNGVSAQGSANSLERLERAGMVTALTPERPWRARGYRLKRGHPLVVPLRRLFRAERSVARREERAAIRGKGTPRGKGKGLAHGWRRRDPRHRRPRGAGHARPSPDRRPTDRTGGGGRHGRHG